MNMEKRYQVFVSSTYADLKEERQRVIQTLMEMDCIPSGMELFPAMDEEQWEFIKRVIDDCDYYLLIIGGRYGSTTSEGISYTEKEYDYAIKKELKIIALVHEKPDKLSVEKSDIEPELRDRLDKFREKVKTNRLVKFWNSTNELPGLVALNLTKTIKTYPAIGWARANQISNTELLTELNDLRKANTELEQKLNELKAKQAMKIPNLATLDDTIHVEGRYKYSSNNSLSRSGRTSVSTYESSWEIDISWGKLFSLLSPFLLQNVIDSSVEVTLADVLLKESEKSGFSASIEKQIFQTIKIQLMALNLVEVKPLQLVGGGQRIFWKLSEEGLSLMMSMRTIKSNSTN